MEDRSDRMFLRLKNKIQNEMRKALRKRFWKETEGNFDQVLEELHSALLCGRTGQRIGKGSVPLF